VPTPPPREPVSLRRNPAFTRLFCARLISAVGTGMAPIALPFAILDDLGGGAGQVGGVLAIGSLTQVLMQLFAGALADRGSRRRQMAGADVLAAIAQGSIAVLLFAGAATLPWVAALCGLAGVALAMHYPAAVGMVPLVVPREQLQTANAWLSIAQATAIGLGAAVGGLVAAGFGAAAALAIDAATFAVSAILVAGIRGAAQQPRVAATSLFSDLLDGWREFTAHRWLFAIVLQFSVMLMGWFGTFAVAGPVVAKASLGGPASWGWISAAFGFGLVVGGSVMMRIRFRHPMRAATLACLPSALVPLLLVPPAPVAAVAAAAFATGIGFEVFGVQWNTALHTRVAPEALSRVSSYDVLGSIALVPLGEALMGWGMVALGATTSLLLAAGAIVLPTLAVLCVREVRELADPAL